MDDLLGLLALIFTTVIPILFWGCIIFFIVRWVQKRKEDKEREEKDRLRREAEQRKIETDRKKREQEAADRKVADAVLRIRANSKFQALSNDIILHIRERILTAQGEVFTPDDCDRMYVQLFYKDPSYPHRVKIANKGFKDSKEFKYSTYDFELSDSFEFECFCLALIKDIHDRCKLGFSEHSQNYRCHTVEYDLTPLHPKRDFKSLL